MNWILPIGSTLRFQGLSSPIQILRGLGGGSQGQVYEGVYLGESIALKWLFPACLARDAEIGRRLSENIRITAPSRGFLWPIAILHADAGMQNQIRMLESSFGYAMPLRPPQYIGAHHHIGGEIQISLQNILKTCFNLVDAFHQLHACGRCYKDISLGNIFIDPASGDVLICDNDNIDVDGCSLGSVLGTPGFMAPEVLLQRARPGVDSDLFSLAVLLFRLLTLHDPLKGQMELDIHCLDEPARRRLYGEDPVYIFNPDDRRNRPHPMEHKAVLTTWPIYPEPIKRLFEQTFCEGMLHPTRRALTGQWKQALAAAIDQRILCPHCGQEVFPESLSSLRCWSCDQSLPSTTSFHLAGGRVAAQPDNELHAHHLDPRLELRLDLPFAKVRSHPTDPSLLGLENLSSTPWQVDYINGEELTLAPGKSCNLAAVSKIDTLEGPIRVVR